jgi:hypothetical protein
MANLNEIEGAHFSECTLKCAPKELDTATLLEMAMLVRRAKPA